MLYHYDEHDSHTRAHKHTPATRGPGISYSLHARVCAADTGSNIEHDYCACSRGERAGATYRQGESHTEGLIEDMVDDSNRCGLRSGC